MRTLSARRAAIIVLVLGAGLLAGCGTTKPEEETATAARPGPATEVDVDQVRTQPHRNVQDLIKGRAAGVYVTETADGGVSVRIRGTTSPGGNNEPLYVVDGVPVTPGPGGALVGININDVESIEVLKGADAGLYGVRGANGVVVVKTKRGKQ